MMGSIDMVNTDIMQLEQNQRLARIRANFEKRELLALAGYVSPAARGRAYAAGWLLRLAVRLDERIATRVEPAPPGLRTA